MSNDPPVPAGTLRPNPWRDRMRCFGQVLALILLWVGFGLAVWWVTGRGSFFSGYNQSLILAQTAVVAAAACGMTMIIVAGGIDLACGGTIALAGVVAARALEAGWPPLLAVLVAMATGALVGLVSGGIIAGLRMLPFIVTLGMMGIARGSAKAIANDSTVNFPETWINVLMKPLARDGDPAWLRALVVAPGVWLTAILTVLTALAMRHSVFGRHLYALGSNEAAARLCGIRVQRLKLQMYALAGAYFGFAGLLNLAKIRQGDPTSAPGYELDVIAAVVIGGASLSGGVGSVAGAIIGALMMAVLRNGSSQLGWANSTQEIIIGVVIVVAVGIDQLRQRRAA